MTDGADVRRAISGPDITPETLIPFIQARNAEDASRASDAAESRQKIGEYVEDTGINTKALAWLRQIKKAGDRDKAKAADIIRSLEAGLPMVKVDILGNEPADMFDGNVVPFDTNAA